MLNKELLIALSKFGLNKTVKIKYLEKTLSDLMSFRVVPDENGNPIIIIEEQVDLNDEFPEL